MEILEGAKAHFRDRLAGGLRFIEVPEWGKDGEPAKIFYKPSLNFQQQEKILKLSEDGKKGEAIIQALIERALDADGNRIFRQVNRLELMKQVDPEIISRIVSDMSSDEESLEDMEKN